jgi:hypothetical protein
MNKFIKKPQHFIKDRVQKKQASADADTKGVPRITNETVAEVREDVLGSARKLIYPLTHSKHRVVVTSTLLLLVAFIAFFSYMAFALYRQKSTSDFVYRTTQVVPFPVAKVGSTLVPYEDYLFELKRYIYYYNNVEDIDFNNPVYKPQLDDQKKKILDRVVNQAYVRKIALKKNITVSDEEVDARIEILKEQNRLGNNDKVFEDTLRDFYNWSVQDFRRSIRNDILASKVLAVVDVDALTKANSALDQLKTGTDFATVVATYSEEEQTKANGGEIPGFIDPKDRNTSSELISALKELEVGEVSEAVNAGYGLEILKKLEERDGKYRAAHIVINFQPIENFLNDEKEAEKATVYIRL